MGVVLHILFPNDDLGGVEGIRCEHASLHRFIDYLNAMHVCSYLLVPNYVSAKKKKNQYRREYRETTSKIK